MSMPLALHPSPPHLCLYRHKGFQFLNPTPVPVELKKKLSESKSSHASITDSLKKFKGKIRASPSPFIYTREFSAHYLIESDL
jgi:hypothetical protein